MVVAGNGVPLAVSASWCEGFGGWWIHPDESTGERFDLTTGTCSSDFGRVVLPEPSSCSPIILQAQDDSSGTSFDLLTYEL